MDLKLTFPTKEEWLGFGRHVVSYSAGAATGVAGIVAYNSVFHVVSPEAATGLTAGFASIADGLKAIVAGVTTLVGGIATVVSTGMGIWAAFSSSKTAAAKIASTIPGTIIVTDPALAASTPAQPNIVSNADVKVVSK